MKFKKMKKAPAEVPKKDLTFDDYWKILTAKDWRVSLSGPWSSIDLSVRAENKNGHKTEVQRYGSTPIKAIKKVHDYIIKKGL